MMSGETPDLWCCYDLVIELWLGCGEGPMILADLFLEGLETISIYEK